ncbi:hypothetical protein GCM10028790_16780 [Micromonospora taraxaci]
MAGSRHDLSRCPQRGRDLDDIQVDDDVLTIPHAALTDRQTDQGEFGGIVTQFVLFAALLADPARLFAIPGGDG